MSLMRRFLRESRRGLVGWSLGLVGICAVYLPLYPSMAGPELSAIMDQMPEALRAAMGMDGPLDGVGYTHASIYGLIGTLLMIIAAVGWGARAVAGDEESGALELTLSYPVTRQQVVLERALALAVQTGVLAAAVTLAIIALSGPSELGINPGNAVAAGVAFWVLGLVFGYVSLAAGALSGRRSVALGTGAGAAVAAYLAQTIGSQLENLEWLARLSPFRWAFGADPLRNGFDPAGLALLALLCLVLLGAGVFAISRRDVGIG